MRKVEMKYNAAMLIGLAALSWNTHVSAQSAPEEINADYEGESANPATRFYTLPLRYKGSFGDGFYRATSNAFEISNALVPIPLDENWFLITRSKGAFVVQPPKKQGGTWESGFNNAQTTLFLSPARGGPFFWGAGPVISLPTATNSAIGTNKWGFGPSVAFTWQGSPYWSVGLIANNVWRVGGSSQGNNRTSRLLLNPSASYRFGDGWSLSTSPNITTNEASKSNKRWTVPVGAGVGKAFKIGAQPVTLKFETYYNVVRPGDSASVWAAQLTLSFQFAR
jgi:hypothetical protein